jgi:hypothetical protein
MTKFIPPVRRVDRGNYHLPNEEDDLLKDDFYHRCEAEGCELLSLIYDHCVIHRDYDTATLRRPQ